MVKLSVIYSFVAHIIKASIINKNHNHHQVRVTSPLSKIAHNIVKIASTGKDAPKSKVHIFSLTLLILFFLIIFFVSSASFGLYSLESNKDILSSSFLL